jgi:hypothetical protein
LVPDDALAAWMKEKGLTFPTRPSATIIPLDAKTERRPLGLAPVLDDDDRAPDRNGDTPGYLEAKRLIAEAVASLPEAARNQPATIADVFEGLELPHCDRNGRRRRHFEELPRTARRDRRA